MIENKAWPAQAQTNKSKTAWRIANLIVQDLTPPLDPARATDHYAAQASRSNSGIFINQKDD
jgi:hypothetical protein